MKTVAVIFGGKSAEHDVSIVTALGGIIKPLEASGNYVVEVIYIAKDGSWHWDDKLKDINLYSKGGIADFLQNDPAVSVTFDGGLSLSKSIKLGRKKTATIDVAFPATHGTYGEDGSLMGLLRMAGIPFVGCDMEASVIAMNKLLSHQVISCTGHRAIRVSRRTKNWFRK
jgi:D-alanine-D-alanine ligase